MQLTESAGWWMGDDDSHGVVISMAGGVRKMVRVPTPKRQGPLLIGGPSLSPNPV